MEQEKEPLSEDRIRSRGTFIDFLIIIVLSIIAVIVVLVLPDGNLLRILFGIPFLLFIPGYALVSLMWTKRTDLGSLERIALSFGLSIAAVIVISLVLNYSLWGLRLYPLILALFGLVVISSIFGLFRRLKIPKEERFFIRFSFGNSKEGVSRYDGIISMLIVASLIAAGAVLTYVIIMPKQGEIHTEFYILDQNGTTRDYPKNLNVGENGTIIIGLANHEGIAENYRIVVNLLNETDAMNGTWEFSLNLNDNELREFDFNFDIPSKGTYELEFQLYRESDGEPYLELHLNGIVVGK